jgi:hypothetical protein
MLRSSLDDSVGMAFAISHFDDQLTQRSQMPELPSMSNLGRILNPQVAARCGLAFNCAGIPRIG